MDTLELGTLNSDSTVDMGLVQGNYMIVDTYDGSQDSYQFEIAQSGTYDIELANLAADLDLAIADSEGNTIYSSSESGNQAEFIAADFEPGTYFAYITGDNNVETSYSLSITELGSGSNSNSVTSVTEDDSELIISQGDIVYRFIETEAQTQFYTTSETERDSIIENLSNYEYEGESFIGAPSPEDDITGIVSIYRLFNNNTGVHLYTDSQVERDYITENLSNYTLEGIAYYGYESQQEDTVALYRFYNQSLDAHFYTPSVEERNEFLADSNYQLEGGEDGVAFYVEPVDI